MRLSHPKVYIALFSLVIIFILFAFLWSNYVNTIPIAPIYGNATKISESSYTSNETFYPLLSYNYASNDVPEHVIEFYAEEGYCIESDLIEDRVVCRGETTPFGEYTVYIDKANDSEIKTNFRVEITWDR